jgi:PBP1b-binding outer membrane lipoprotein LpoB
MKSQTKIIVIASVILILILGIRSCTKKEAAVASKTNENIKTTVKIQPPLPGIDVPIQKFEINPSQSNVLVSKGGAKINIPANAFLDKDGIFYTSENWKFFDDWNNNAGKSSFKGLTNVSKYFFPCH